MKTSYPLISALNIDLLHPERQTDRLYYLRLTFITVFLCLIANQLMAQKQPAQSWKRLFNGKDLSGWDSYLIPSPAASDKTPIGLNKDPHAIFTVVDGTIRISGQDWGSIITHGEFENYHLRFQSKWGEKKWPPREKALRDGGLLYHSSGPNDFGSKCWMRSSEMQIQEGEIGDFHNVGAGISEFQLTKTVVSGDSVEQYNPNAEFKHYKNRVYRSGNFESPHGEWTTGEMVARGADAVFIVNGFVVNRAYNAYRMDLQRQVTRGKIQFQSEGAEHFLRNIEIRPLAFGQQGKPVLVSDQKELLLAVGEQRQIRITNQGDQVEIIAAELLGKGNDRFVVKLPALPLILKKGETLTLPVSLKPESKSGSTIQLRMETVYGPVEGFEVILGEKTMGSR
jgi:hypothetical protein